ncbi:MAG: phospholipase D family protein [Steroidobacteraceae bacterium]|jgi:putative cardiolipin synthase|nr:phospholipase D family protein [Steroidobacteraceae bacterium]
MKTTFVRWLVGIAATALAGCAGLGPRPELPEDRAIPPGEGTILDGIIAPVEVRHPGQSGFRLVSEGPEAFAIRARSAVAAGRSLDVQTYIFHDDLTGGFLGFRLVEAADRGVRVRLLVDDMDARSRNYAFAALDAHPNIEVRMFNPFASRSGQARFAAELVGDFGRLNRRMHNKSWIADNRIAIVGGRNLGNEYFGASEDVNFVDLDFAMVGPVVRQVSESFDRYWNSSAAYPISVLAPDEANPAALEALRKRIEAKLPAAEDSNFARELRMSDALQRLTSGDWPMHWSPSFRFVSDDPLKVLGEGTGPAGSRVLEHLVPVVKGARTRLTVISPYFVPGKGGTAILRDVAQAGADVGVLTNSLAANDVAAVYGGYAQWREPLLEGGVKLWELKPSPGIEAKASMFGSSGASLHTKSLAADGRTLFVGSFNLDPRSASLNTEQGVFVDSEELAAQLEALFARDSSGERAWSVSLDAGHLRWTDEDGTYTRTPQASAWRKFQAWLARVLPIQSQL